MTNLTFDERIEARHSQPGTGERGSHAFFVRALLGNVALLSGLMVMPLLILVGYLVPGQGVA